MTVFHPRHDWRARPPKRVSRKSMNRTSTGHWNGPKVTINGKTSWDHSKCPSLVRGIQNFHMDSRGWTDIAYNFIICPHDHVYEGRGINVQNGANGTNTGNATSHAIMWLSGDGNPFTDGEKAAFKWCVNYVADKASAPRKAIGHRDHKATACPGDERYGWIRSGMPGRASEPVQPKPTDVVFELGSRGPGVGLLQVTYNILHKERIPATGNGHGRILPINDEEPYFGVVTQEATREVQRFLNAMWVLGGKKGLEPKVTGKVDHITLAGIAFWVNQVLNK